eukprot:1157626-Pelagomonas_calceolata.AAC.24
MQVGAGMTEKAGGSTCVRRVAGVTGNKAGSQPCVTGKQQVWAAGVAEKGSYDRRAAGVAEKAAMTGNKAGGSSYDRRAAEV